jgi:hypothetical protein
MIKNFIDEEETFKVNDSFDIELKTIGKDQHKILIVDNFYKNPMLVRDLACTIPPTTNQRILLNLPGGRTSGRINAFYDLDHLGPVYDKLIKEYFFEIYQEYYPGSIIESFKCATFMVNVMSSSTLPPRVPHVDMTDLRALVSTIYLNVDSECNGGTAFYSFGGKEFGLERPSTIDVAGKILPSVYVNDDIGDWKKIYTVDMKFNRMILYSQALYHSAYIDESMFNNNIFRLNQQFFI